MNIYVNSATPSYNVVLNSIMSRNYVPGGIRALSGSIYNDCSFNRGCVDGTFCEPLSLACKLCDVQCSQCFSASPNDCQRCYPTSPNYNQIYTTGTKCPSKITIFIF